MSIVSCYQLTHILSKNGKAVSAKNAAKAPTNTEMYDGNTKQPALIVTAKR
jgi:hypothetical protein